MTQTIQVNQNDLIILVECLTSLQEANTKLVHRNIQWSEVDHMKLENELIRSRMKSIKGKLPEVLQRIIP